MTRNLALAALSFLAAAGVALAAGGIYDSGNFTMDGRKWQPAPAGHVPGKDDVAGALDASHHPGDDCGICHAPAASPTALYQPVARSRVFTITGTIFDSRAARRPVPGGELVLEDYGGNVTSVTANDLGNFFTEAPMSGDPAITPALPDGSDTWRYKAWVKSEGGERPMMTMPAVGGMTVPRMSCSMHHVNSGTLMGAWASPRATLKSYPAAGLSYRKHVFPILRSKCGPCHIPGPTEAAQAGETFDYGAGLDLLTYAGSTVEVTDSTGAVRTWGKIGIRTVVNTDVPEASMVFAKTMAGSTHGGGAFWTTESADYRALRTWIAEGALDN
jgi:hypothetical protein